MNKYISRVAVLLTEQSSQLSVQMITGKQCGITCGAMDEPSRSSKAIDKSVIINFRDKNVAIARFRDKNEVFVLFIIHI